MSAVIESQKGGISSDTAQPKAQLRVISSTTPAAEPRKRHVLLGISFLATVIAPILLSAWYLYFRAADQYASTVGFSVRAEEMSSPLEFFGGIADLSGSSSSDADILFEYIQSQELIARIDRQTNLREIFAGSPKDPVFALDGDAPIEDLVDYWNRMVRVNYNTGTGLIELRVLAFDPNDARRLAQKIFDESSLMINELSAIAREDATRYAREDLEEARLRLVDAREALTAFRSRTQIVDPTADIQTQMGLLASLEEQQAEALIELDLLRQTTRPNDLRISLTEQRIGVIQERIAEERRKFGIERGSGGGSDYASIVSEFERLSADREFAEEAHKTALASYYAALAEARRQSRYLAAYIEPTLAESSEFPRRLTLIATVGLCALVAWSVVVLIYYSVRDRR